MDAAKLPSVDIYVQAARGGYFHNALGGSTADRLTNVWNGAETDTDFCCGFLVFLPCALDGLDHRHAAGEVFPVKAPGLCSVVEITVRKLPIRKRVEMVICRNGGYKSRSMNQTGWRLGEVRRGRAPTVSLVVPRIVVDSRNGGKGP